jgi:hypothetical protein
LKKTATEMGDERWCFMCDPETKRQIATWLSQKKQTNKQTNKTNKTKQKKTKIQNAFLFAPFRATCPYLI